MMYFDQIYFSIVLLTSPKSPHTLHPSLTSCPFYFILTNPLILYSLGWGETTGGHTLKES